MRSLVLLCVVFSALSSRSQSLVASVTSSAGDFFLSSQGSMAWTVGEIMDETYQKSQGYLTQGFHQPTIVLITDVRQEQGKELSVYPNPVQDFLIVKISKPGDYNIELYDLKGTRLISTQAHVGSDPIETHITTKEFAIALYLLRITDVGTAKSTSHRIEKISH